MPKKKGKDRDRKRGGKGNFPDAWDPDEGDKLVGKIVRHKTVDTRYGETGLIDVKGKDGEKTTVWCGNASLSIAFDESEKGDKISIEFLGKDRGRMGRRHYIVKVNGEELDLDDDFDEDDEDDDDDDEDDDD